MEILITSFTFPPQANGVAHVAYQHAMGFIEHGHKVTIATGFDPQRDCKTFPPGLEVVQFKVSGNANIRTRYRGEIKAYQEFIGSFTGDIICCHCWQTWVTDLAVKSFPYTKAKKILVSHGVSANGRRGWPKSFPSWVLWRPYVWWSMPKIMRSFDHIVFISNKFDHDRFYDRLLANRLKYNDISVIPNGVDLNDHDKVSYNFRRQYNIGDKRIILCVGKYNKGKNEEMVLSAFIAANLENAVLVLIGPKKNDYSNMLENIWNRYKITQRNSEFICLENVSKEVILSAYKAADLYLCGSVTECFPLVILDAMASGTPFISTDVGCVRDFQGGILVQSTVEMTRGIRDLMNNSKLRNKLGSMGRLSCEDKYNWNKIINEYQRLFERLLV